MDPVNVNHLGSLPKPRVNQKSKVYLGWTPWRFAGPAFFHFIVVPMTNQST